MAKGTYRTQGGGKAIRKCLGWYVFIEVPKAFPEISVGDEVPCTWGVEGPFDENNKLIDNSVDSLLD